MVLRDGPDKLIGSILILCTQNSVRSPMLEGLCRRAFGQTLYVRSAGVEAAEINPFAIEVMAEIGLDIANINPAAFYDLPDDSYDLIIILSRESYDLARKIAEEQAVDIEYWSVADPPAFGEGNREQTLESLRRIRDDLTRHLENRFDLVFNMEDDTKDAH